MSIFPCRNPFQPRKAPARKMTTISPLQMDAARRAREFGLDFSPAYVNLEDDVCFEFDLKDGDWYNDSVPNANRDKKSKKDSQTNSKESQKVLKNNQQLQEENNLLKAKNEILIDMMAEVYSEYKLEHDKQAKK